MTVLKAANEMILLTRFNGTKFYINAHLIQTVEGTPDTVITLTTNTKILVKESPEVVVEKVIAYQRVIHNTDTAVNTGE